MPARFLLVVSLAAVLAAASAPAAAQPGTAAPAAKKAAGPNRLVVWQRGDLVSLDPDGGNRRVVLAGEQVTGIVDLVAVSPDGKRAAVHRRVGDDLGLYVHDLGRPGPADDADPLCGHARAAWSADGTELAVCTGPGEGSVTEAKGTCFRYNPATKAKTPVPWPAVHRLCDWSPDGRTFLTIFFPNGENPGPPWELRTVGRDGTPRGRLAAAPKLAADGRYSPDGTRVLALVGRSADEDAFDLTVFDLATGRATPVRGVPANGRPHGYCWSPDGARIAYVWRKVHPPGTPAMTDPAALLVVCDPDGGNPRTILSEMRPFTHAFVLAHVNWR